MGSACPWPPWRHLPYLLQTRPRAREELVSKFQKVMVLEVGRQEPGNPSFFAKCSQKEELVFQAGLGLLRTLGDEGHPIKSPWRMR